MNAGQQQQQLDRKNFVAVRHVHQCRPPVVHQTCLQNVLHLLLFVHSQDQYPCLVHIVSIVVSHGPAAIKAAPTDFLQQLTRQACIMQPDRPDSRSTTGTQLLHITPYVLGSAVACMC